MITLINLNGKLHVFRALDVVFNYYYVIICTFGVTFTLPTTLICNYPVLSRPILIMFFFMFGN